MTTNTTTQKRSLCLSDYGLQPRMTVREIMFTLEQLKTRLGDTTFRPVANSVYFNLNEMKPGQTFEYRQFFKGEKLEVFLIVAHCYMIEHMDYEFANDYSVIRRTN
ncbi:MAG: hypothetical protein LBS20_10985 [Prevotella sp.]|nr:hypothetical protein [Prevotella sp.]